ncbi:Phox/Bem1p [Corchorus capsularis]|uniref:Phox/Bem1p n=1 Tax=Corchorus capsularis TaxID=210143 RepID=A0A1R3ICQ5_COCAP|nr:Phox/Bem1p [Corchorus capsularis]
MDPPPTTASTTPKLRLMCSYGGHVIPRPQTKSLYYAGGENRIVTIPAAAPNLTLSSLIAHLSSFLHLTTPFVLKYQLPNHDLDSLISISTDDDLQIMLEEQSRLSSTASPSRIRLFLFPVNCLNAELSHPKRESCDDFVGSAVSNVQTGIQDQVAPIAAMESKVSSNPYDSGVEMHKPIQASGFPMNLMDQPQQQKQLVYEGTHYIPQNMPGVQPVTSYYPVYHQVPQEQHLHFQSNQPYPVYYLPVVPTQSYNIPVQCGMVQASTVGSGQPQTHPNASSIPPQRVLKEVTVLPQPMAELNSQTYQKIPGHQLVHVPYNETETRLVGSQIQHQPQAFGPAAGETATCTNKLDDDLARVQIYKSQPPPPTVPSQYQTMTTKAATLILSEALVHTDNAKQQFRTSEPQ